MNAVSRAAVLGAMLLVSPRGTRAAEERRELTFERALTLARERAAPLRAAEARIDEARGRVAGAQPLLRENPEVEVAAGPRTGSVSERSTDLQVGVRQVFEWPGRRGARLGAAEAGVQREVAVRDDLLRTYLADVARAFAQAVHAREKLELLRQSQSITSRLLATAQRRRSAGDASALELNVSRAADAQARAQVLAADGELVTWNGELARLLSLPPGTVPVVLGSLGDIAVLPDAPPEIKTERADVLALRAEVEEAEAERRLGGAEAWPDVALGAHYGREGSESIVLGTLSVSLPVFERGQQTRAVASARARRTQVELEALSEQVHRGVATARERAQKAGEAVRILEADAVPVAAQNEELAAKGYAEGELPLAELMVIRREALESRAQYLDRLLDAALARIDLAAELGVLR